MSGLGNSSVGSAPFGVGTPSPAGDPPLSTPIGTRFINPITRDYEQDTITGQLRQMPKLRQRVVIVLATIKRSSTVLPNLGVGLPKYIDETFESAARDAVRQAFKQEVDVEKIMRIDSIEVERILVGRVRITLVYTDLTTGSQASESVVL